ncbi:C-type lectin domain family 2 member D-like, partial [Numida meleagris]|uniref:C-type lectin domain family 2 member D-like n=1 Tax=Numida meleagris TaxID=8996 RepID=UPI000B3D7F41
CPEPRSSRGRSLSTPFPTQHRSAPRAAPCSEVGPELWGKVLQPTGSSQTWLCSQEFMLRYQGPANCWIGLHREEGDEHWTWPDGSAFTNWFQVRGGGRCAYLNGDRISSALCHTEKYWVCSRADSYVLWRKEIDPQ